jgi:ankyrin repeat protein
MGKKSKAQESHMTEDVPLECTQEEFQELSKQVAELSTEGASEELLECARYGETDAVRALLDAFPDIINSVDGSGSTALHKACANGHVSTATLLIQRGANQLRNQSGNTPLHWAAASGHEQIVRLVLERSEDVDVLQKNDFGRSVLTEGFLSQDHGVVKLLLEHDSASEEKLLEGGAQVDAEDEKDSNESKSLLSTEKEASVLHDFSLCDEPGMHRDPLRIRELVRTC